MNLFKTERVYVEVPEKIGEDAFGADIYGDEPGMFGVDVLVEPASTSDVEESNRPDGSKVKYRLHFPKAYDGADLENKGVWVRGERLRVIGAPGYYTIENTPGLFNMRVEVGAVHG